MTQNGHLDEAKEFDPTAVAHSVQELPPPGFRTDSIASLFFLAQRADEFAAWGTNVKLRDAQLRDFIPVEPLFASALGIVTARNAAFSWKLEGPPDKTARLQKVLQSANFGKGWQDFIAKISIDLYTQDAGAFFEIIRATDSIEAPVIGIAHLDAARCYHTGHPDAPVIYFDRLGRYHYLKWYQVCALSEIPATYEGAPGLQYCALTRLLRAARIVRDMSIYIQEKVGGRNARAVSIVKGVTPRAIQEAWEEARLRSDAAGFMRFSQPIIVGSVDPKNDIGFETLELASLPDGFDLTENNKQYITQIAMAFLSDYQEFSPLPGGNLGTSQQSEILHLKSRGKGPGLFMKRIEQAFNWNVLPEDVEFGWAEQDTEAELAVASVRKMRAEARKLRVESGELTPQAVRQVSYEEGDLSKELLAALEQMDLNPDVTIGDISPQRDDILQGQVRPIAQTGGTLTPGPSQGTRPAPSAAPSARRDVASPDVTGDDSALALSEGAEVRAQVEDSTADAITEAFARALGLLRDHVGLTGG